MAGLSGIAHGSFSQKIDTRDSTTVGDVTTFASGGSWTGDGTVEDFVSLGTAGHSASGSAILSGVTSGSLLMDNVLFSGEARAFTPNDFYETHTINVTGGTANVYGLINSYDNLFNLRLVPEAGVTSVEWTTEFSHSLHSRRRSSHNTLPWLGSLQMPGSADVDIVISDVYTETSSLSGLHDDSTVSTGVEGGIGAAAVSGRGVSGVDDSVPGILNYTNTAGGNEIHINSIIPEDMTNAHNSSSATPYGAGPMNDDNLNDGERVYAKSITWSITADDGAFDGTELFIFSFDGALNSESLVASAVPEPSTVSILAIGGLVMIMRRKRVS